MGGHIPVKNKRARETEVSRARFIFSGENILPLYQGTGEGLNLEHNMLRVLVINDRAGLYG